MNNAIKGRKNKKSNVAKCLKKGQISFSSFKNVKHLYARWVFYGENGKRKIQAHSVKT